MSNKLFFCIVSCLLFFVLSGCFYDVEEVLYPGEECNPVNVSYSSDIQPIFVRTCFVCHSASARLGDVSLEDFNEVLIYVNRGSLVGSINHESGYIPMPENAPKLPACDIQKIEKWVEEGSRNN